jgi:hypothetical protein
MPSPVHRGGSKCPDAPDTIRLISTCPLFPLAIALPRMLQESEAKLAAAEPAQTLRLRKRAELLRGLLTPRPADPLAT